MPVTFKDLSIPNPCYEKWSKMTKVEKGRFCSNCQNVVYDLRNSSEEELNALIYENGKKGNFCIRVYEDQISPEYYPGSDKPNPYLNYFRSKIRAAIALLALKLFTLKEGFSQMSIEKVNPYGTPTYSRFSDTTQNINSNSKTSITGILINKESKDGIIGETVYLFDSKGIEISSEITDNEGNFKIHIPDTVNINQEFLLVVSRYKRKSTYRKTIKKRVEKVIFNKEFTGVVLERKIISKRRSRARRVVVGFALIKW